MTGIVNWNDLRQVLMPRPHPRTRGAGRHLWDKSADMYNQMAKMEKIYTLNQLNAFDTAITDTVLDIGCGPGRISVPMAQRAKRVTSLDSSEIMLAHCKQNAKEAGVNNLNAVLMDWKDAVLAKNLEPHDIVIASRSPGSTNLKKITSFAKKYVVLIGWANAPNIPMILGDLFKGTGQAQKFPSMRMDRRLSYNATYNTVYDMGYEPNVKIVADGFTRNFSSKEEAYDEFWKLSATSNKIPAQFRKNVDKWLKGNNNGGVTFTRETRSFVIWWEPNPVKFTLGAGN